LNFSTTESTVRKTALNKESSSARERIVARAIKSREKESLLLLNFYFSMISVVFSVENILQ